MTGLYLNEAGKRIMDKLEAGLPLCRQEKRLILMALSKLTSEDAERLPLFPSDIRDER